MATAADRRAYAGPPLFSFGFRPFFLFAAIWSALAVPLWLLSFFGLSPFEGLTREWHLHEMLFGVLGAIISGFLLTAVPNWTGRMPVMGTPLAALFGLWLAGRAAMLAAPWIGIWAAVIDAAFLLVFAGVVWREVLSGRNWRNTPVCLLVTVLAAANIAFHLSALEPQAALVAQRLALGAVVVLVTFIGGRIVPSFTRNWLMQMKSPALPAPIDRLDHFGLALTVAGMAAWVVAPDHVASGGLLVAAGLSTLVRLGRWRGARTGAEALVWILHVGIAWLGVGKILLGLSVLTPAAPVSMATHALTAGAIGVMTLAVMTRATLGHTGRERTAGAATLAIYVLVNLAAAVRVAAGLIPEHQVVLLGASGLLWAGAYGGFALAYGPLLIGPKR